jgi:hypothetical protein
MLLLFTVWIIMIPYTGFFGIVDSIAGKMGFVVIQNELFGGGVALIWWKHFNGLPSSAGYRRSAVTFLVCETFKRAEMLRVLMRGHRSIMSLLPSSHFVSSARRFALGALC